MNEDAKEVQPTNLDHPVYLNAADMPETNPLISLKPKTEQSEPTNIKDSNILKSPPKTQPTPIPPTPDKQPTIQSMPIMAMQQQQPIAEETKITETRPPFWKRILRIK